MRKLVLFMIINFYTLLAHANSGYFLCTEPEPLIDQTLGIEHGDLLYNNLGLTELNRGQTPERGIHLALNFLEFPYQMEVHHGDAMFQSGFRVFRQRQLQLVKGTTGTHSGVTLYKTQGRSGYWNMVSQSGRELRDNMMPWSMNHWSQGTAYALVGRRVALIGYTNYRNPPYSFCVKQDVEGDFTTDRISLAFRQLMKDFKDRIKGQVNHSNLFEFEPELHEPMSIERRLSMIEALNSYFQNPNYAFRSQYGEYLALGAAMTSSLLAMRLIMRRANIALAILPPDIIDSFFTIGLTPVYTTEDSEIGFHEIEELFADYDPDSILAAIDTNPRLEAYLRILSRHIYYQTRNPNEI